MSPSHGMKSQTRRRIAMNGTALPADGVDPGRRQLPGRAQQARPELLLEPAQRVAALVEDVVLARTSNVWRALKENTRRVFDSSAKKTTSSLSFIRFCSANAMS